MLKCDETCTCPLKEACLGRRYPESAQIMREHWESDDPVRQQHVINRSRFDYTPRPNPAVPPPPEDEIPVPVLSYRPDGMPNGTSKPKAPGLMSMVKSFTGTMVEEAKHVVSGGSVLVREETFNHRLAICRGQEGPWGRCKYLDEKPILRCLRCGCSGQAAFRIPVKECPIGRWGKEQPI